MGSPLSRTESAFPPFAEPAPARAREAPRRFRDDIEGLRAVAIGLVVLYHAGWSLTAGGYRGVDVFFVLSGFLITSLLVREVEDTGTISLTHFWARRARRLLPAAAVMTIVVLIADLLLLTPFDQVAVAQSIRASAAYVSNVFFAVKTTQYFSGGGDHQPMLHTWSLSAEEQFYLLFAPMLLALAAWSSRGGFAVFRRRFLITTAALTLASMVGWIAMLYWYPLISFFILPTRIWELGLGALTVFAARGARRFSRRTNELVAGVAMVVLLVAAAASRNTIAAMVAGLMIPTIATAVLVSTGTSEQPTIVARALSTPPMRFIGRVSYEWYLWHWPALVFLEEIIPQPTISMRLAVAAFALVPSYVTYRWVTSPIRFSRALQGRARFVVATAVASAVALVGLASAAIWRADGVLAEPRYRPIVAGRQLPDVYDNGCHVSIAAVRMPACVFGHASSDTTVVLFGDSHAAQWFPALDTIAALRGWTLVSLTKSACPSADAQVWSGQLGRRYTECDDWRRSMLQRIATVRPTLVVIANTRAYEIVDGGRLLRTDRSGEARALWQAALRRTLDSIAPTGARMVVLQNNPHPSFDVPNCAAKHLGAPSECASFSLRSVDTVLAASERAAVSHIAGATYLNMNDLLCDGARCPAVADGVVRYMDTNHISVPFALALAPALSRRLSTALEQVSADR